MADNKKLIEIEHLKQYFATRGSAGKKKWVQAVDDVSFFIYKGDTLSPVAAKPPLAEQC